MFKVFDRLHQRKPMAGSTIQKLLTTKTVGFLGGFCLLFNQMTGPAIPFTSANFQDPGWLFTTIMYLVFSVVSGFSVLFLVEAIKVIPGNSNFQGDVEYGTIINFYFGKNLHFVAQLVLYGALQSNAIQCIVLTAQATDNLLISLFGSTCGLSFSNGWMCVTQQSIYVPSPFESNLMVFTFGLLVVILFCLPLSFTDMDNNIMFNILMAMLSIALGTSWIYSSFVTGLDTRRVPAVTGLTLKYGQVVGTVLLNLGATTVVPTWINLKHRDVSVQNLVWIAIGASTAYYICIGVLCGLGFPLDESGNLLHSLLLVGKPELVATISIGVFAYVMLLPSVPVSFMVSRDNLVQNEVMSKQSASFLSFVLPWILLIPLQTGVVIYDFQTWMSLFFTATANFVIPFLMYFKCVEFRRNYNKKRILTLNQVKILRAIHKISDKINQYMDKRASRLTGTSSQTMPEIQINNVPICAPIPDTLSAMNSATSSFLLCPGSKHSDLSTVSKPGPSEKLSDIPAPSVDEPSRPLTPCPLGAISDRDSHTYSLAISHGKHSDDISQTSRDAQVVLRHEFAVDGTPFVDPADLGLPVSFFQDDIPDPISPEELHTHSALHYDPHIDHLHTPRGLSQMLFGERPRSPIGVGGLPSIHIIPESQSDIGEHIQLQTKNLNNEIKPVLEGDSGDKHMLPGTSGATLLGPFRSHSPDHLSVNVVSFRKSGDQKSRPHSEDSSCSFPHEREYIAPPFRVLPNWLHISERMLAQVLLACTGTICFANVVFYGYLQATGSQ
ncbi:hypothetical protein QVD99_007399 [Batrachochytrium dendrobatidis]|nr:hypothetical protein O5D80_008439 [Batrachochytrium dendrobatidis]KAK5665765.1 hypothetical protein QVD99_007399 [Batrachochytrium dendrobatidis]